MDAFSYVLAGGFARGYRTYIMACVGVVTAVAMWAAGDADLVHTIQAVSVSLGLGAVRAAIPAK